MMRGSKVKQLLDSGEIGTIVVLNGWVRQKRQSKEVGFLEINDGSTIRNIQAVIDSDAPVFSELDGIALGACLRITGELVDSPGSRQSCEIRVSRLEILGESDVSYPLQKKRHSFEFLRSIAHLRPRTNTFGAIFRVRSAAAYAVHEFFQERGFKYITTPILTGSDCEGAGEMFHVTTFPLDRVPQLENPPFGPDYSRDFFKREAGLTVSGQLEAELLALALTEVYTFGPTFRAENSNTPRHVAEFWMVEPEMAFYDLEDTIYLAETFIKQVTQRVLDRCPDDMDFFAKRIDRTLQTRLKQLLDGAYAVVSYTDAIGILEKSKKKFEFPVRWGIDLQTEHEKYLTEKTFKKPVFVTDYPVEIKAFYMRANPDGKTVAAVDLLVPQIGEIIGGSQREERMDYLLEMIERKHISRENLWWYLEVRRFGSAPHSGFGMGFSRFLQYLTGMGNIRDVIPFPRTPGNIEF